VAVAKPFLKHTLKHTLTTQASSSFRLDTVEQPTPEKHLLLLYEVTPAAAADPH
jgi:hypothetical protein